MKRHNRRSPTKVIKSLNLTSSIWAWWVDEGNSWFYFLFALRCRTDVEINTDCRWEGNPSVIVKAKLNRSLLPPMVEKRRRACKHHLDHNWYPTMSDQRVCIDHQASYQPQRMDLQNLPGMRLCCFHPSRSERSYWPYRLNSVPDKHYR